MTVKLIVFDIFKSSIFNLYILYISPYLWINVIYIEVEKNGKNPE